MCHGDFPDDFFMVAEHKALYNRCLHELDLFRANADYYRPLPDDEFAMMGRHVAGHISSGLRLDNLEVSYLNMRAPGVRQAVYKAALKGPSRIICAGAAGMMYGHGASESLPYELRRILRDNPALDLALAPSGIGAYEIALLIRRSLEYALKGTSGAHVPRLDNGAGLEDAGVVLICSSGYDAISERTDAARGFSSASAMLSEMSREAYLGGGSSRSTELMQEAASSFRGFQAVEAGFIDFALPDIGEAASRLAGAGSTHIIAAGMPSLLNRHPYSLMGPTAAIELLRKKFSGMDIVYVKPDPLPIASGIASLLIRKILDVDAGKGGASLKGMLRGL